MKKTARFTETVLDDTWSEFEKALKEVPFSLWNESTFRWFFIKSALKLVPKVEMHIEWNRFDLLATLGTRRHLIEFKFFVPNRRLELDRSRGTWKGGPGSKNLQEFGNCVTGLSNAESEHEVRFNERSIVMVFPDRPDWNGKKSRSYREQFDQLRDSRLRKREPLRVLKHDCDIDGCQSTLDLHCIQFDLR